MKQVFLFCFVICVSEVGFAQDCAEKGQSAHEKANQFIEKEKYSDAAFWYKEATKYFIECLNNNEYDNSLLKNNIAVNYLLLGISYRELKQWKQAIEAFEIALTYKSMRSIYADLADIYDWELDDKNTALLYYEKALTLPIDDKELLLAVENRIKRLKSQGYQSSRAKK